MPGLANRNGRPTSGRAAGLERRQPLSNVDRGAQLTIDAIDPGVEPPDFGDDFVTQRIDPCDDTVVEPVDLLVQSGDLHGEARVHAIDLRARRASTPEIFSSTPTIR